jgi:hypothetical protein
MKIRVQISHVIVLLLLCCLAGCTDRSRSKPSSAARAEQFGDDETIGMYARVNVPTSITVSAYGLVGGLTQGGSTECPGHIRQYLKQMVRGQGASKQSINIDQLIASESTAVVYVEAILPAAPMQGDDFDVTIVDLSGVSLLPFKGGWLYKTYLRQKGMDFSSKAIATAQGPVYVDVLSEQTGQEKARTALILGGGHIVADPQVSLVLNKPDFQLANLMRNTMNNRFGAITAQSNSSNRIDLTVPASFKRQRWHFFTLIEALYLNQAPSVVKARTIRLIGELSAAQQKDKVELALEGMGPSSVPKLGILLKSSDEATRLAAARSMAYLESDRGQEILARIAMDRQSGRRIEAIEALALSKQSEQVMSTLKMLMNDEEARIAKLACEYLSRSPDPIIRRRTLARAFTLETIPYGTRSAIIIYRTGKPKISLIGPSIICRPELVIQSHDSRITLDTRDLTGYVRISRKAASGHLLGPLLCSNHLIDLIQMLCAEPTMEDGKRKGLGVSYSDLVILIERMGDKGLIDAEVWEGSNELGRRY